MNISSAAYDSLSPTNLDNFNNLLRLPANDGIMGIVDASDAPLRITTGTESVEVLPGKRSEVSAYRVERDGKTFVNPTIRVRTGSSFSAELANGLDEETTIHWHGQHIDWRMDGHPLLPVSPDATYRYAYPVANRGGTYWYHPHAHGTSARQTYSGLAGFFIVEDEEERRLGEALDLKLGETDIPLLIQDKMFDESGNFVYAPGPMDEEMGYEGNVILTNLTPNPYLEVVTRIYRFRLLNGSNARNLRLAFSRTGEDELLLYHVIATDGGLLDRPRAAREVFLSPAERVDVLVDLTGFEPGEEVVLRSLPFDPMHREHEMAGHMDMGHHHHMGPARLSDGHEFYLLRLVVSERVDYARRVPETLSESSRQDFAEAATRTVTLSMAAEGETNRWLINGLSHEMGEYPIVAQRGAKEIWEVRNDERSMPHPMHLHGFRFLVLERTGSPEQVSCLAVDDDGRTVSDLGFKDTVLIWPGETMKAAVDLSHGFEGEQLYMFHCHILEHEKGGMMLNLKVVSGEA
ncbi:MAG: multicopper oxidase family protein [Actinobacteria bacterium]|nr:multicopper oxidase family protein [Actinomycetota bacterium]